MAGRHSVALELNWNEIVQPEQLSFGAKLGTGGSAEVFRGTWGNTAVAIKQINGIAHLEEMAKEINALRKLRHPRLVRFLGSCVQTNLLLVVTEFMAGGILYDRIFSAVGKQQPLAQCQRFEIAAQMTDGLVFLHSHRVVHRDLKSMNILLDAQGNARICDFGLAHQMDIQHTSMARKNDGEGGSPRYMAPECYDAAHGKLTEKVDVWALGCILLEVFATVLPYSDCSTMAQLSARIVAHRRPPDVPKGIPPAVAELIRRCHEFLPTKRLSSAELHGALLRARTTPGGPQ